MRPPITPSSPEEVRQAIEFLKTVDLSTVSIDDLKAAMLIPMKGHEISAPIFDPGIKLYRARKVAPLPTTLREIGMPPTGNVRLNQRCNRAGQSMFYCSSARNAPFFEVHSQVGDHLVLSEWVTRAKMMVNHVG